MESRLPNSWTNEKHVQFLNTMEASFVCSMIENKGRLTRLDRYMPDSSDSTLDRIKTKQTAPKKSGPVRKMDGGVIRKTRRLPSQPFIASKQLDQVDANYVVPQFEIAIVGNDKVIDAKTMKKKVSYIKKKEKGAAVARNTKLTCSRPD